MRLRILVTPLVLLVALACWSANASAADHYGAIAFSQASGAVGYSYDFDSRDDAEERALQECGPRCEVVIWFKNACAALAVGDDKGYGTGWAADRDRAEEIAMMKCEENSDDCSVKQWACTTR
jgi:serine/threonine-protein kinase